MTEIKIEDRAYFAGLFDGEGCVFLHKSANSSGSVSYDLGVSFSITHKPVLREMQKFFGGSISTVNMEKKINTNYSQRIAAVGLGSPEKWKQQYHYCLHSRKALYFLKVIEPFCREKKEQAALAIRYEQGRRSSACRGCRSERETERCEFFYRELQRLKHEQLDEVDTEVDFEDEQQTLCCFEAES